MALEIIIAAILFVLAIVGAVYWRIDKRIYGSDKIGEDEE